MKTKIMLATLGDLSNVLTNGLNVSYLKHILSPIIPSLYPFGQEVETKSNLQEIKYRCVQSTHGGEQTLFATWGPWGM